MCDGEYGKSGIEKLRNWRIKGLRIWGICFVSWQVHWLSRFSAIASHGLEDNIRQSYFMLNLSD